MEAKVKFVQVHFDEQNWTLCIGELFSIDGVHSTSTLTDVMDVSGAGFIRYAPTDRHIEVGYDPAKVQFDQIIKVLDRWDVKYKYIILSFDGQKSEIIPRW